jgi:hypothetical protein
VDIALAAWVCFPNAIWGKLPEFPYFCHYAENIMQPETALRMMELNGRR